jgi:serine/threonine-protein kinase
MQSSGMRERKLEIGNVLAGKYRALPLLAISSALVALTSGAAAEPTLQDRALADKLYAESDVLAKGGKWKEAKEKLEASLALDPGIGTLTRLAICEEKMGNVASAISRFHEAEDLAWKSNDKRAAGLAAEAKRLEPSLATLRLDVAARNRTFAVEIRRDGTVIQPGAYDTAIPVDPGEHLLEATGPGKRPWKTTIRIEAKPGETRVVVPVLEDAPAPPADAVAPVTPPPRRSLVPGFVLFGLAAAGIGVDAALFVMSARKRSDALSQSMQIVGARSSCVPGAANFDTVDCGALHDQASAYATLHNAAVAMPVVAGVLAAGAITYLVWPIQPVKPAREVRVAPEVAARFGGLSVSGSF